MFKTSKTAAVTSLALAFAGALALTGCEEQGPAEQLGESVDESAEEVGEAIEEAGEDVQEGTQ